MMNENQKTKKPNLDLGNFNANVQFLENTGLLNGDVNANILEIGCGAGRLTNYLTLKGCNTIGFDIDRNAIIEGRIRYPDTTMFLASGTTIHFQNSSFEIVISFDVLEHMPDVDAHLSEVRRVLKRGGYYLFQTPNKLTNLPFEIIKNKSLTHHKSYHCSLQTLWTLKRLLKAHKFKCQFVKIPVMNEFMERKIEKVFGYVGVYLLRIVNIDRLPLPMRTNFYVCAVKL